MPKLVEVKEERIEIVPIDWTQVSDEELSLAEVKKVLQKKTNTIKPPIGLEETKAEQNDVPINENPPITKDDTVDSLRERFPHASPFEFQYLLFLKENVH